MFPIDFKEEDPGCLPVTLLVGVHTGGSCGLFEEWSLGFSETPRLSASSAYNTASFTSWADTSARVTINEQETRVGRRQFGSRGTLRVSWRNCSTVRH
jgi:hypothetical protein